MKAKSFLVCAFFFFILISYAYSAPPSFITITSPQDGGYVNNTVLIEVQLNQIPQARSVKFYIDNQLVGEDATSPYQYSWDTTSYPDGTHEIYASMLQATERPPQIPEHPGPFDGGSLPILDSPKITVTVDNTPPEGIISINKYAVYTNSVEVILTLSATDNLSSVDKMKFSNDGSNWSDPEDYTTSKAWTLTDGDGTKTVYVSFKDTAGNWSGPVNDVIILDTTPTVGITLPQDNSIITRNKFTIKGIAEGVSQITVNGKPVVVNPDGTFEGPTLVAPGYAKRQNITSSDPNYIIMNFPGQTAIKASAGGEEEVISFYYYQPFIKSSALAENYRDYLQFEVWNTSALELSPFEDWEYFSRPSRGRGKMDLWDPWSPPYGWEYGWGRGQYYYYSQSFYGENEYGPFSMFIGRCTSSLTIHTLPAIDNKLVPMVLIFRSCSNSTRIGSTSNPSNPLDISLYKVNGKPLSWLYGNWDDSRSPPPNAAYVILTDYTPDTDVELNIEVPVYYMSYYDVNCEIKSFAFEWVDILKVEMTAYRPQTTPFNWWAYKIPDDNEEDLDAGAGIRINGDDDNHNDISDRYYSDNPVTGEDDLIMVTLEVTALPLPPGLEYVLKRSNSNINVWESPTKGAAILEANDEEVLTFDKENQKNIWVENPYGGNAFLEFEVRTTEDQTVVLKDRVYFYSFTSVVIALGGENQIPTDPPDANYGTFVIAKDLYLDGYDVHMYDEDNVGYDGSGIVYDEVGSAVENRDVSQIAIFGYSHGGGSTYNLAERMTLNGIGPIPYTAYIDAVEDEFLGDMFQEQRRPPGTAYLVNYYQEGVLNPVSPDFDGGLDGGPVPGADYEVNVDDPTPTETHFTIDDDPIVLNGIKSRLTPRVTK